jgi:hypothetical protein
MAPGQRRRVWLVAALVATVIAASLAVQVLTAGATYEIVLPAGTGADADPTIFETVPHRRVGDVVWLELEPGDTLVLRNLDVEVHQLAGIAARPGETVLHTFNERGTFSDECSLELTVFVEVQRR